jgi:hypothetical protein
MLSGSVPFILSVGNKSFMLGVVMLYVITLNFMAQSTLAY